MATVTIKIEGLRELRARVQQLTEKTRKKVLGPAVAAGAAVTVKEAKKTTAFHDQSGDLRRAIKQRRSYRNSKQDYEERHVGVFKNKTGKYANNARNRRLGRAGQAYMEDPPEYYWRFLELGTVKMTAKPFLQPAFNASKERAATAIKERLVKKLDEVMREMGEPRK